MNKKLLNQLQNTPIDAMIKAFFYIDDVEYEIEHFRIVFGQPIDHKGQPQSEVGGGQFVISMSQLIGDHIYNWAKGSNFKKDCFIKFKTENQGTIFDISFFDAHCISLISKINAFSGSETIIVISPRVAKVKEIEHDNDWRGE